MGWDRGWISAAFGPLNMAVVMLTSLLSLSVLGRSKGTGILETEAWASQRMRADIHHKVREVLHGGEKTYEYVLF